MRKIHSFPIICLIALAFSPSMVGQEPATSASSSPAAAASTTAVVDAKPAIAGPIAPTIKGPLVSGDTKITGTAQKPSAGTYPTVAIYVCVTDAPPPSPPLYCDKPAVQAAASLTGVAGGDHVDVTDGTFNVTLSNPLAVGKHVYVTQVATPVGISPSPIESASTQISIGAQCNKYPVDKPYSDCDLNLSLVAGVEQSAQSSLSSEVTPFVRIFTRAAIPPPRKKDPASNAANKDPDPRFYLWGTIRFLGAPTTSSTQGVVSVVSDPAGNLSTQTFSTIGTSLDVLAGGEIRLTSDRTKRFSASFIAAGGGTTPLQANTLALAFQAPPFGAVECSQLVPSNSQNRFTDQFNKLNILSGSATNTTGSTPACLVNGNSPTTTNGVTTYTPITTIAFSNQDRSNFFGKYEVGFRTIDRYHASGTSACGDSDPANSIGPCERGIIDWTFGQDSSITGGRFQHVVFKIDAVYPLPVPSVQFLYLLGSITFRLTGNTNLAPLILQSAPLTTLTGTGATAVPNTGTVVLSLVQPDRDFYRFGAGINLNQLFTKLFTAKSSSSSQ